MKIKEITRFLDQFAPPFYQENYDNAGLITGNSDEEVTGILLTLDATEEVVDEAIAKKCNMIVAHHPIVFKGLKKLNGKNYVERTVIKAIKNDIAIYASHTNLDSVKNGVNFKIAQKIGLENVRILMPKTQTLNKLATFVPVANTDAVLDALYAAGAGNIGNYSECSFTVSGTGFFKPGEEANPVIGTHNIREAVHENRIEVIFPSFLKNSILTALRKSHPYEEVAYYITALENENQEVGFGAIGNLPEAMTSQDFLAYLKLKMNLSCIRYTRHVKEKVQKIAVCGGSGSFLLQDAIRQQSDVFISADFKYHEFFDAENHIMIADIGHYESEIFTKELFYEVLSERFSNIALVFSEALTNPVRYFS
jgi:dinuclear metal center YbgI/SA1388 family protein